MQISKIKRKIYLLKEQNTNNFNVAGKYEHNSSMNTKNLFTEGAKYK